MAIRILTDSAADFTPAEIERNHIQCVPMTVTFGADSYQDGVDLTREAFYERLQKGEYPSTSQPAPAAFLEHFQEARDAGDDLIAVLISGELSGTVQSAQLAKDLLGYDRIFIVDSRHATVSMRFLVNEAIKLRAEGKNAHEITEALEGLSGRIVLLAGLDTLEYLAKGGRISRNQANLGNLVNLKPLITFEDGSVKLCGKQIGFRRAYRQVAKLMEEQEPDPDYPVYFLYTYDKSNCFGFIASLKRQGVELGRPKLRGVGPTIGTHIGIGAFGVVYVKKVR